MVLEVAAVLMRHSPRHSQPYPHILHSGHSLRLVRLLAWLPSRPQRLKVYLIPLHLGSKHHFNSRNYPKPTYLRESALPFPTQPVHSPSRSDRRPSNRRDNLLHRVCHPARSPRTQRSSKDIIRRVSPAHRPHLRSPAQLWARLELARPP